MKSYAFAIDLDHGRSVPLGAEPSLAEGLDRELAFEQAGPAGHWLVLHQEGPAAGEVTSLPGVEMPHVELAIKAAPAAGAIGDIYAFTIPPGAGPDGRVAGLL